MTFRIDISIRAVKNQPPGDHALLISPPRIFLHGLCIRNPCSNPVTIPGWIFEAVQTVDVDMLQLERREEEYRVDVLRETGGSRVELL